MASNDHLQEYLKRLRRHNDPEEGRQFTVKEVLNGPFSYHDDIELVLQVYGDYVVDVVKTLFPPRRHRYSYQLYSFIRPFTESLNNEEKCLLYFTTVIQINDVSYEVVVEKQEFIEGIIGGKTRAQFNRKTRDIIVSVATRLMNLGADESHRRIAVPLPAC